MVKIGQNFAFFMLKVHQLERKKKNTTARRDDRDKYQPAMISEHLNCLFDSCLSEIVSLEVFLESAVSVLVFLPSWAVTSCVMVLFCRLAVRPDHFQFFALCFLYFSIPVNFQKRHNFGRLNCDLRGTQVTRQIVWISLDFPGFCHLGLIQAWDGCQKNQLLCFLQRAP